MSADGNATPLREPGLPEVPEHRLLRCVGGGSYGEVWLAQNVNGHFRAIKVVNRSWFRGDDRPFEREYEGLCRFDPVSRRHPSQLPVLQIGRNDPAGYFYYVMEPADDVVTGAEIQPDTYLPKTLSRVLKDRGRLPLQELLPIALSLTDALDHLHRHQLVHRDIRPSNILWHLGVPKLADIGLVTATGDGSTLVGTRGYFPDGGVVDASGDLFALGKVLYQAATGLEPALFPRFPDNLPTDAARQEMRELNEILFRACASDPEKRYRSASEMRRDLAALDAGQSLWKQRRQRRMVIGATLLSLLLLAVGTVARWAEPRPPRKPSQLPIAVNPGLPAGLIHWWPGDGDARDHAGNAHGKLLKDGGFVPGRIGQAFAGVVEIPDQPDLNFRDGQPFTIALWAYATNVAINPQHLLGKRDESVLGYQMAIDGRGLNFGPGGWAGASVNPQLLPNHRWTHLAMTVDGKGMVAVLVDGRLVATGPGRFAIASQTSLKFGGSGPYRPFAGYLDDIRIYDRVLAEDDVKALIHAAPPKVEFASIPPAAGLIHWWPGDGDAKDVIGHADGALGPFDRAGLGIEAAQVAGDRARVAVDGVEITVERDAGGEVGEEILVVPDAGHAVALELEAGRARRVAGGNDDAIANDDGVGGVDIELGRPRVGPDFAAAFGFHGDERAAGEEQHGAAHAGAEGQGRGVARLAGGFPDDLAGGFLKGRARAAGIEQEEIPLDHGRTAEAPVVGFVHGEFVHDVARPEHRAFLRVEGEEIALAAEGIDHVALDRGRGAGAALIVIRAERARVGVPPEDLAGGGIEGGDAVLPGRVAHGEGASAGDGEGGETQADIGAPEHLGSGGRPLGGPAFFRGDAVVIRAAENRPVIGADGEGEEEEENGEWRMANDE